MASGHRHWTLRLQALQQFFQWVERHPYGYANAHITPVRRADRRQLRKLLGRHWGLEWRIFGCTRRRDGSRAVHWDDLNIQIAAQAKAKGHIGDRMRGQP